MERAWSANGPSGRWEARVEAGGPNGYRVRKSIYRHTKAEATAKLRQTTLRLERGHSVTDERMTVETFLTTWLSDVVQPAKRHSTWQGYSVNVNRHLLPLVGRRTLAKLSPADVQAVINAKRREGLSPRTVQYIHATLRAAIGMALRWGMVDLHRWPSRRASWGQTHHVRSQLGDRLQQRRVWLAVVSKRPDSPARFVALRRRSGASFVVGVSQRDV